jgi:hypothetical protein
MCNCQSTTLSTCCKGLIQPQLHKEMRSHKEMPMEGQTVGTAAE